MKKIPFYKQYDSADCGPTCIRMIAKYYGKSYSLKYIRDRCSISRLGISMLSASDAAESLGFRTLGARVDFQKLTEEVPLPCIVHWKQNHFIVVYKISKDKVYVSDPAKGLIAYSLKEFLKGWGNNKNNYDDEGLVLMLEPAPEFYRKEDEEKEEKLKLDFITIYIKKYKKFFIQLVLGMLLGSVFSMILPFLSQAVVDVGIQHQNLTFVYMVLIAQAVLTLSRMGSDFIQSWISLHVSTRINISLISDYLLKLMKLPIHFFDSRRIGDILQRIGDHSRIQSFLTTTTLGFIFSIFNGIIFAFILCIYNIKIFLIFMVGNIFYVGYILLFLRKRRELDFKRFDQSSDNQTKLVQLISGMQEIKLNICERQKRWEWENIQAKLFKISVQGLSLGQYQQTGAFFINQSTNILISVTSAEAVITGNITLGMMISIQYMLGQLSSPIQQLIGFIQGAQDAKISLERLSEIHLQNEEEQPGIEKVSELSEEKSISISDLQFKYEGSSVEFVLKDLNLNIPYGKITAIVGMSGSGKTTLLKLLLGFYQTYSGDIKIGDIDLKNIDFHFWRQKCGVVMQDGYIFHDTIIRNIIIDEDTYDKNRFKQAVKIANIKEFVEILPLGYQTKIGVNGIGLSQGQKQRILIARAVYKNPEYIIFDEATNSLDANNERMIMENMNEFIQGRTAIIVAHRLSTVKNADQIVVLEKGRIEEIGNHNELTEKRGKYYNLVKNQLELGQ
jgi:ATP-binding cassette, subfamily B, bacterial